MPRRSKVELSPETIAELEEQFYNFLHSLSPEETNKFFKEFLTTEEKMMMYKRLALYWSLFEGYSLASIQRMLGITHDTTRIYNKRKNEMSSDFKNLLHRIGRDENGESIKEAVVEENLEDAPVVLPQAQDEIVEETVTVVEEIIAQEPQNEEQETTDEKVETEPVHSEETQEEQREEMETKSDDQEEKMEEKIEAQKEESEEKNEDNNEEENPEKKKKGFGRFFGF